MTYSDIKFQKTFEKLKTNYRIMYSGKQLGIVGKRLSGGFSFYWQAMVDGKEGIGSTRKEAVQKAI